MTQSNTKMKMVYSLSFLIKEQYAEVTQVASNTFHLDIASVKKRIKV